MFVQHEYIFKSFKNWIEPTLKTERKWLFLRFNFRFQVNVGTQRQGESLKIQPTSFSAEFFVLLKI